MPIPRIFTRLGLKFRVVWADSGEIGGSKSQEFHVIADSGEDAIAYSDEDDYASNIETAATLPSPRPAAASDSGMAEDPDTGRAQHRRPVQAARLDGRANYQDTDRARRDDGPVALVLRGDHELNAVKAQKLAGVASPLTMADADTIRAGDRQRTRLPGPGWQQTAGLYYRPRRRRDGRFQLWRQRGRAAPRGVNFGRDLPEPETVDLRNVVAGDPVPGGRGTLKIARGIEVGHIFQLGTKYSEAMRATIQDQDGKDRAMLHGLLRHRHYTHRGRGDRTEPRCQRHHLARAAGAVRRRAGPDQPAALRQRARGREALYAELQGLGLDVLLDDRDVRPGVKFADAELIGIPHRVVLSERGLAAGELEYRHRRDTESRDLKRAAVLELLQK